MIDVEFYKKLLYAFPNSFINNRFEFIAHVKSNTYFGLEDCKYEIEVESKVLEWCSRACCKTEIYKNEKRNDEFHDFMLKGVNDFLGTKFDKKDMELIYSKLGNSVRHNKTLDFIASGYDMDVLMSE